MQTQFHSVSLESCYLTASHLFQDTDRVIQREYLDAMLYKCVTSSIGYNARVRWGPVHSNGSLCVVYSTAIVRMAWVRCLFSLLCLLIEGRDLMEFGLTRTFSSHETGCVYMVQIINYKLYLCMGRER